MLNITTCIKTSPKTNKTECHYLLTYTLYYKFTNRFAQFQIIVCIEKNDIIYWSKNSPILWWRLSTSCDDVKQVMWWRLSTPCDDVKQVMWWRLSMSSSHFFFFGMFLYPPLFEYFFLICQTFFLYWMARSNSVGSLYFLLHYFLSL